MSDRTDELTTRRRGSLQLELERLRLEHRARRVQAVRLVLRGRAAAREPGQTPEVTRRVRADDRAGPT